MMKKTRLFATLVLAIMSLPTIADCNQECDAAYTECKADNPSPNGEKICSKEHHDCKTECADKQ